MFLVFLKLLSIFVCAGEYRIVSLNPTITEILFELDLGDSIVGVTQFSEYPEAAKKITRIGSYLRPQIEKIIELRPTHVIAYNEGDPSYVESFRKASIPFYIFDSHKLEQYENVVMDLSKLFNKKIKGQKLIEAYKKDWDEIKKINSNKKILIQVDQNPTMIAGGNTFISQGFEICGAKNIFKDLNGYKQIQLESLKERSPEDIIVLGQLSKGATQESVKNFWLKNPLTKNAKFVWADPDTLGRLSPRFFKSLLSICKKL